MAAHLGADKQHDVADDIVDIQSRLFRTGPRRELTDTLDHVRRPVAILHDPGERFPDAAEIRSARGQPIE